jgi:predicted Rossmann-fold nucleotide-binding protein
MPGGIGTLDEWMSTLAVMTIGNDDPRPIVVANIDGLYDATIQQLADMTHTPFARGKNLARTLAARTTTELLSTLATLTSH